MKNNQKEISEKFKDLGKEVPQDTYVWRQIFDSKNKPIGPASQ